MINPYTLALLRSTKAAQDQAPARPTQGLDKVACSERVLAFFASMEINHGGNKARVETGIAHTMSKIEIDDTIARLIADRDESANYLTELNAPPVIIENERKKYTSEIKILQRVRPNRP